MAGKLVILILSSFLRWTYVKLRCRMAGRADDGAIALAFPPSFPPDHLSFAPSIFLSSDALMLRSFPTSLFPPLPLFSSSFLLCALFALSLLPVFSCSLLPLCVRSLPCPLLLPPFARSPALLSFALSFLFPFYPSPLPPLTAAPSSTHTILRVRHGNEGCPSSIGRRA
jgi:hypothetical protein